MAFSTPVDIPRPKTSKGAVPIVITPMKGAESTDGLNPDPIAHDAMQDLMLEEYLSPRRLRELTGVDNLDEVEYLELRVDTSETTLGNFGILVPNLKHLKLTGSSIQSVRDLGSSLDNLQTLWMATTGLHDIDGLSSMCNLRELYLAFNDISDLSPCSMLDDLRTLDLEGNQLDDISQVEFLSLCTKLADLTLRGNPFCDKMTSEEYRKAVFSILPNLKNLDDKDVSPPIEKSKVGLLSNFAKPVDAPILSDAVVNSQPVESKISENPTGPIQVLPMASSTSNPFTDDWNLINQFVREGTIGTDSILTDSGYSSITSPGTTAATISSSGRSATARPHSTRPITSAASPFRPLTSLASTSSQPRLGSSGSSRPTTSRGNVSSISPSPLLDDSEETASSLLTKGPVMCGNPSRALRHRKEFATSARGREDTASSSRGSSAASPNNDTSANYRTVIGPENASLALTEVNPGRLPSVASLGESTEKDVGSLLQDIDKWRTDFQISAVKRMKERGKPDVLVVQQGLDDADDDEDDDGDLELSDSDDEGSEPQVSPRPPVEPRPPVNRRIAAPNFTLERSSFGDRIAPPTILAPPLPLPAIGATFRPMTSTSSGSRMSSKIQYVSAKPSQ